MCRAGASGAPARFFENMAQECSLSGEVSQSGSGGRDEFEFKIRKLPEGAGGVKETEKARYADAS
jgi:hypothetical protein